MFGVRLCERRMCIKCIGVFYVYQAKRNYLTIASCLGRNHNGQVIESHPSVKRNHMADLLKRNASSSNTSPTETQ